MKKLYSSVQRMAVVCLLISPQFFPVTSLVAQQRPDGITPGILNVKVTEETALQLERSDMRRSADDVLLTGIQSLDAVNQRYQVRGMKRVFKPGSAFEAKHRTHGLHLWYQVSIDSIISPAAVISAYRSLPGIINSEPVYKKRNNQFQEKVSSDSISGTLPRATNDPRFPLQWHFNNSGDYWRPPGIDIDLLYAWELETGNSDVVVAVIDGGIDTSHPDLIANMWRNEDEIPSNKIDDDGNGYIDDVHGYNFAYDRGSIDPGLHPTHVAGTVAATSNNGIGVAGVAGGSGVGDGARLMSCAVFSQSGATGSIAEAYVYSADNGAIISQNSWGYWEPNVYEQVVLDAIDYFIAEAGKNESGQQVGPMNGGVVIFAAGNSNSQEAWYPAFYEPTIAVAATTRTDEKAPYSNYGEWIDIAAPGGGGGDQEYYEEIWSTFPGNNYGTLRGTSMASPHVSGVAALIVSEFGGPGFTPGMLREKLLTGTESIDDKNPSFTGLLGAGRLNAYASLISNEGIPPDPIHDLRVVKITKDSAWLEWTTPADPDGLTAYRSELRYGWQPFTEENFFTFGRIFNMPVTRTKGMKETLLLTSMQPEQVHYFAIVSYDFYGNRSGISNVPEATTLPWTRIYLPKNNVLARMKTGQTRLYSFLITNPGKLPLQFKFVQKSSSNFGSVSPVEGTVQPYDSVTIQATLRSHNLAAGEYFQTYEIQSNADFDNPYPFYLQMIVTDIGTPVVSLVPKIIDFQNGFIGTPKEKTLTIHNDGTEPLVVTSVTSEHPVFTTSFKDPLTIDPFKDAIVTVTFKATERKSYDKRLIVQSNDPIKPVAYVRMVASGVMPPDIEVFPTAVNASLNTDQKISIPVRIKNTGQSDLEFSTEIITSNEDTALVHRVLILTPDFESYMLPDLFKGDAKIQTDIFPRDSIRWIKLNHLAPYNVVFVNNLYPWSSFATGGSPTRIGDVLADYLDQGGKVIVNMQVYHGPFPNDQPVDLKGRFIDEEYGPFLPTRDTGCEGGCSLDSILIPTHPLMKGITTLQTQTYSLKPKLAPGAVEIARWNTGDPLVAVKQNVVAVNTFMVYNAPLTGEFPRLYQNAVRWLRSSFISTEPQQGIVAAGQETSFNIQLDATSMKLAGKHERTILLHHNVPEKKTIFIPVSFETLGPALVVSPDSIVVVMDSLRTATHTVVLRNASMDMLSFSVRIDSARYILAQPESGTIAASDSVLLTLSIDARQLPFGEYIHPMTFLVDGTSELTVPIVLIVKDDPQIEVTPLKLETTIGFREDTVQYFELRNTGGSPLMFSIEVDGAGVSNTTVKTGVKLLEEDFENPVFPPVGWKRVDNLGYGWMWDVSSRLGGNFAGTGEAATMLYENSDSGIDTELLSPKMFVQAYDQIVLEFAANHQGGQLDVDILIDGKLPWKNIFHCIPGLGWYYSLPGEVVSISLDAILAEATHFQLRWRNYYLAEDYGSGYSQIDDVSIHADPVEWLAIQPATGVVGPGDTARIAATFYAEDLEAQTYNANVLVRSNAVHDPLVNVAASIRVLKPAILVLKPDSMYQTLREGASANQKLIISNQGESPLRFIFDDVLVPTSASIARKASSASSATRRISSTRSASSKITYELNDVRAISRPASAKRVQSPPVSNKLYATGFEEFFPGELDLQEGWYADPGLWSIESERPFAGIQHLRGVSDTYGFAAAFSPYIYFEDPSHWPAMSSASMQINLDSALGGQWQVVPQAPQAGFVVTRIDFTPEGTMRALVRDSVDEYSGYFVDIPVVLPKGYFELRVDVSRLEYNFKVYVNNKKVFTGDGFADFIEEVAFVVNSEIPGLKMDVDNFRHYDGIPLVPWVKAEPVSGVVRAGETFAVNIHFDASELGPGTFYHELTFGTNDPQQSKTYLPVTLRVSGQEESSGIQDFSLLDMRTGSTLSNFVDSVSMDVGRWDARYLIIRANTQSDSIGSVSFQIDGGKKHVENKPPYLLPSHFLRNLSPGPHLLTTEVYPQPSGKGTAQQYREAVISIINGISVSGFEVLNQYGERIQDLRNGDVLNAQDPRYKWMNIRALLTENPVNGSVKFSLNETPYRIENQPPYIMVSGNRRWWTNSGSYTVQATPFSKKHGKGASGKSLDVNFTIVDDRKGSSDMASRQQGQAGKPSGEFVTAFPVPTDRLIHVSVFEDVPDLRVQVVIRNIHSQIVFSELRVINGGPFTLDLEKIGLNDGIYYLQLRAPAMNQSIRFIKE